MFPFNNKYLNNDKKISDNVLYNNKCSDISLKIKNIEDKLSENNEKIEIVLKENDTLRKSFDLKREEDKQDVKNKNQKNESDEKKIIQKKIVYDYKGVWGPYRYDDGFIIFLNDGGYEIFDKFCNSIKKGKLSSSINRKPVLENNKIFFCDNSGNLLCYDISTFSVTWKTFVGLASNIDIINLKDYILFTTPDKNNTIVHKKTGIIVIKKYYDYSILPFAVENNIYFISKDQIFILNQEMKEIKKIKNSFDNINEIFYFYNNIYVVSKNMIYRCDNELNYGEKDIFISLIKFYNILYLKNDKTIVKVSEKDTYVIDCKENLVFGDKRVRVYSIKNNNIIEYDGNKIIDNLNTEIINIYSNENYCAILGKNKIIYFWRID